MTSSKHSANPVIAWQRSRIASYLGIKRGEGGDIGGVVDTEVGGGFDGGEVGLAVFEVEFFEGVAEAAPDGYVVAVVHKGF